MVYFFLSLSPCPILAISIQNTLKRMQNFIYMWRKTCSMDAQSDLRIAEWIENLWWSQLPLQQFSIYPLFRTNSWSCITLDHDCQNAALSEGELSWIFSPLYLPHDKHCWAIRVHHGTHRLVSMEGECQIAFIKCGVDGYNYLSHGLH